MMKATINSVLIAWAVLMGCSSFRPLVDNVRYFVLVPVAPTNAPSAGVLRISLAPVEFPEYLRRREIASRKNETEICYSETLRWAEPLDKMFQRTLAENIGSEPGVAGTLLNHSRSSEKGILLSVTILRFEADDKHQVSLEANWTFKGMRGGTHFDAGNLKLSLPAPDLSQDPVGTVKQLNTLVARLASAIVAAVPQSDPTEGQ